MDQSTVQTIIEAGILVALGFIAKSASDIAGNTEEIAKNTKGTTSGGTDSGQTPNT